MRPLYKQLAGLMLSIILIAVPGQIFAESTGTSLDDVLSGFDNTKSMSAADLTTDEETTAPSRWDLQGDLTLSTVFNVNHDSPAPGEIDHRGLSRLRPELRLQLDVDIYKSWKVRISGRGFYDAAYEIQGRSDYPRDFLDDYEDEVEFRETYIAGSPLPSLDVKIGRQVVVWGNTENFRVTDILNPVDNRTPGLVDIEDLRLPVCMARMDYYWGHYSLMAAAVPELRFNKNIVSGSDFYPDTGAENYLGRYPEERLAHDAENTELAVAFTGILPGWDFGLYAARYYNDDTYHARVGYQEKLVGFVPVILQPVYFDFSVYERRHAHLDMGGLMVNIATGDWLWKAEVAYTDGYKFNFFDGLQLCLFADEKSRTDALLGLEYTGLTDTTMTLEVVRSHYSDFEEGMMQFADFLPKIVQETQYQAAFRYTQNMMHDRLELTLLAILMEVDDGDDATTERLSLAYDLTDSVTTTVGAIFYQGGDQLGYETIHKNNRVFLDIKYSF